MLGLKSLWRQLKWFGRRQLDLAESFLRGSMEAQQQEPEYFNMAEQDTPPEGAATTRPRDLGGSEQRTPFWSRDNRTGSIDHRTGSSAGQETERFRMAHA